MRSPEELLQELDQEASDFSVVAIVVAFDDTSRYVFHEDDSARMLSNLKTMIDEGGEPFGLLGYIATEKGSNVASFVYEEYKQTVWALPLMEELAQNMVNTLTRYQERTGSA